MIGSTNKIECYLDKLFPDARCELIYNKDYELLLATMLSAQTMDKRVNMVTAVLFKKYPTIFDLAKADINDIKKIIRPLGNFNVKAYNVLGIAKSLVNDKNGVLPNDREYLESLPGVGRKTANVVLSNIFNVPCIAVDTHVTRVSKRLGLTLDNDNVITIEKKLNDLFDKDNLCKIHHQLVLFGRYYCLARNPKCETCELKDLCRFKK